MIPGLKYLFGMSRSTVLSSADCTVKDVFAIQYWHISCFTDTTEITEITKLKGIVF